MKDYHGNGGEAYNQNTDEFSSFGFTSIPVLEFIWDRKWDAIALAYVHALRPSYIRVTTGNVHMDAKMGRVTVYVSDDDTILYIEQEVEVGLPDGIEDGHSLEEIVGLHDFDFGQE